MLFGLILRTPLLIGGSYSHLQQRILSSDCYIVICRFMQKESQRHNDKGRAKTSLKKYAPLTLLQRFACERELETEQRLQYIDPQLLWPSALCLSRSPGLLNRRPGGPLSWLSLLHLITNWSGPQTPSGVLRAPSAGWWLSLSHLVPNWSDLQLARGPEAPLCRAVAFSTTTFLLLLWSPTRWLPVSPSYIIVQSPTQSPTQSLEWHVWSSSSGNNCHAVQRSLSSGASVFECIMGFYLIPFRQPNPPMRFLSITGHWNVSLPSGASLWNGMFGRGEGQYTTRRQVQ